MSAFGLSASPTPKLDSVTKPAASRSAQTRSYSFRALARASCAEQGPDRSRHEVQPHWCLLHIDIDVLW